MAAIKNLKKDIHNTLGDLIETCYVWEFSNEGAEASKSQEIIDEVPMNAVLRSCAQAIELPAISNDGRRDGISVHCPLESV